MEFDGVRKPSTVKLTRLAQAMNIKPDVLISLVLGPAVPSEADETFKKGDMLAKIKAIQDQLDELERTVRSS
jgi:hypothetical protein